MRTLFLSLVILLSPAVVFADNEEINFKSLVVEKVIEFYSQGWEDDRFRVSNEDVWGLHRVNSEGSCGLAKYSGYVRVPSYSTSGTYKFFACANVDPNGHLWVDITDDDLVADE